MGNVGLDLARIALPFPIFSIPDGSSLSDQKEMTHRGRFTQQAALPKKFQTNRQSRVHEDDAAGCKEAARSDPRRKNRGRA
jgi:hypothetical protein